MIRNQALSCYIKARKQHKNVKSCEVSHFFLICPHKSLVQLFFITCVAVGVVLYFKTIFKSFAWLILRKGWKVTSFFLSIISRFDVWPSLSLSLSLSVSRGLCDHYWIDFTRFLCFLPIKKHRTLQKLLRSVVFPCFFPYKKHRTLPV